MYLMSLKKFSKDRNHGAGQVLCHTMKASQIHVLLDLWYPFTSITF